MRLKKKHSDEKRTGSLSLTIRELGSKTAPAEQLIGQKYVSVVVLCVNILYCAYRKQKHILMLQLMDNYICYLLPVSVSLWFSVFIGGLKDHISYVFTYDE